MFSSQSDSATVAGALFLFGMRACLVGVAPKFCEDFHLTIVQELHTSPEKKKSSKSATR